MKLGGKISWKSLGNAHEVQLNGNSVRIKENLIKKKNSHLCSALLGIQQKYTLWRSLELLEVLTGF